MGVRRIRDIEARAATATFTPIQGRTGRIVEVVITAQGPDMRTVTTQRITWDQARSAKDRLDKVGIPWVQESPRARRSAFQAGRFREPVYYRAAEVAALADVSAATVRRWAADGSTFPGAFKDAKGWLIPERDLIANGIIEEAEGEEE